MRSVVGNTLDAHDTKEKLAHNQNDQEKIDSSTKGKNPMPKLRRIQKLKHSKGENKKGKGKKKNKKKRPYCPNPLEAVLHTLSCIEAEDAICAATGYEPGFVKLHNGIIDPGTCIPVAPDSSELNCIETTNYWSSVFFLLDLRLDFDFMDHIDANRISLRYVESVKTADLSRQIVPGLGNGPESQTIFQHEFVIVTVNSDCKMTMWDQYGDNIEQAAAGELVDEMGPFLDGYFGCLISGETNC